MAPSLTCQAMGKGPSPMFWHPPQLCSSMELSFLCPWRAWVLQQIIRIACSPWPLPLLSLPKSHHSVIRDWVFLPILVNSDAAFRWRKSSLHLPHLCTHDKDLCPQLLSTSTLHIVILSKSSINIFNRAIIDRIRMDVHQGKGIKLRRQPWICLLTAWPFYLHT